MPSRTPKKRTQTNPKRTQTNPIQTQNKPNSKPKRTQFQTRSVADIPECLPQHALGRGRWRRHRLSKLFLFFTFLCPGYNLAMQNWTIQKLLNWVTRHLTDKGVDSPRLSAELLLSYVLAMKRIELYTQFDKPVTKEQLERLRDLVKRAGQQEPIAYIIGKTEFYSLELNITPDCMIPRPETELLVERAVEFLRKRTGKQFVCDSVVIVKILFNRNLAETAGLLKQLSDGLSLAVADFQH